MKGDVCPHCGGENGLESSRVVRYTVLYYWDGQSEVTHDHILSERQTGTCLDCNKKVRIPKRKINR